jgi:hypothetical protein
MQENEFERRVRERMDEFSLAPNEEVWKQVEAEIRKDKRRPIFFYWIVAGLLLAGGSGVFFYLNRTHSGGTNDASLERELVYGYKKPDTNVAAGNETLRGSSSPAIEPTKMDKNEKGDVEETPKSGVEISNRRLTREANNKRVATVQGQQKRRRQKPGNEEWVTENTQKFNSPAKSKWSSESKSGSIAKSNFNGSHTTTLPQVSRTVTQPPRMEPRTELPPHKGLLAYNDKKTKQDSLEQNTADNQVPGIRDTAFVAYQNSTKNSKTKDDQDNTKKWKPGFAVFAGVSDNFKGVRPGFGGPSALSDRNFAVSSAGVSSVAAVPEVSILQYKKGASLGAVAYLERALTPKWSLNVGVNYQYMSARSVVGRRLDSTFNTYDSVLQKQTFVNFFYRAGQTTSYTNQYHLIQLPVNMQVKLGKNVSHPFLFSFGLSPSFLVGTNALYANYKARAYYREKDQFDKFLLFAHTGVSYTLTNTWRHQLSIGPTAMYNFNSFSKTVTRTREHLFFLGVKTNVTFK